MHGKFTARTIRFPAVHDALVILALFAVLADIFATVGR